MSLCYTTYVIYRLQFLYCAFRVNLVYLDTQETQASKVPWEILVCLGYQGPLEQKDNRAFLDFQVNIPLLNYFLVSFLICSNQCHRATGLNILFPDQILTCSITSS